MQPSPAPTYFHIRAVFLGLAFVVVALVIATPVAKWVERPYLRVLFADAFDEKDQGLSLQHEAFLRDDVLPLYGSSEERSDSDKRAAAFFLHKPTGFQVCPVGGRGNTTLMMAQKIAAQGAAVRGHKVAFVLSSTWFRRPIVPTSQLAGTFSPLQAITFLQSGELAPSIRQRFVDRLAAQIDSLAEQPMLAGRVLELAHPTKDGGTTVSSRLRTLGLSLYRARLAFEDHENMIQRLLTNHSLFTSWAWQEQPQQFNWNEIIQQLDKATEQHRPTWRVQKVMKPPGADDAEILALMKRAREWDDFALLLDTLKSLDAKPLIISVPLPGWFMDPHGVSRSCRDYYYHRVESMCASRGFPVQTYSDHDQDRDFIEGSGTHLDVKGWLYVDRLLDDFYHDRLPLPADAS